MIHHDASSSKRVKPDRAVDCYFALVQIPYTTISVFQPRKLENIIDFNSTRVYTP